MIWMAMAGGTSLFSFVIWVSVNRESSFLNRLKPAAYPVFNARTRLRFCRATEPYDTAWGDLRMKTNDTKFTVPVYQMEGPAWENDIVGLQKLL